MAAFENNDLQGLCGYLHIVRVAGRNKEAFTGKNRDERFEIPFVYGQTIHFVPGKIFAKEEIQRDFPLKQGCESAVLFEEEVLRIAEKSQPPIKAAGR